MVPVLFLLTKLTELIVIYTYASTSSLTLEEWSSSRHFQLSAEANIWSLEYIILMALFSPTIRWAVLVYTPSFIVTRLLQLNARHDLTELEPVVHCLGEVCLNICFGLLLFYIVQTRELEIFYEREKAAGKEQQMLTVLNASSDSILVVEKASILAQPLINKSVSEEQLRDSMRLKVAYCNSKSKELFG